MSRVLLASPYFAPKVGGVEKYAHELSIGLAERGHDVSVLTTATGDRATGDRATGGEGLRMVALPARVRVSATLFDLTWLWRVGRVIASERPDVLITHAPVPGLADVCLAARGPVAAIATYHSGSMKKGRPWPDVAIGAYERTLLPHLLRRADAVVTTCPGQAACGVAATYVPPGVDTEVFHPDPATPRDPSLLLYAGRIDHASAWKGVGTLLEAMRILSRSDGSVRLELAGDGDAVDHYREMAAGMGLGDRVRFAGPLAPERLADAYRRAGVVVLPSETDAEAFGMVLIEAMACGTPVVASNVGGMPAVVADTGGGVLAEPGDPASLAGAIGGLLADPDLCAKLGAAGLERVARRYRWDAVVDAYEDLMVRLTKEDDR